MIEHIQVNQRMSLSDYSALSHLTGTVHNLLTEAKHLVPNLKGRTVWMVNSTAKGGGVAEMLPMVVTLLRDLGVQTEWLVMNTDRQDFFPLTKHIHNMIHGQGNPELNRQDRELYDTVSRENADIIKKFLKPNDILVVHDPQPLGMGAIIAQETGIRCIWRCHIGLDRNTPQTKSAWGFLRDYALNYSHAVFTTPEYIPGYLAGCASIIHPGIDPLGHKNRDLSIHKVVGILCNARLAVDHQPVTAPFFERPAMRLQADGSWKPAIFPEEIGMMYRPIVTQISRWDRLKGFRFLLDAFVLLKKNARLAHGLSERDRRRLDIVRLVLAGPDPASIQDDPEGKEVLDDLVSAFRSLEPEFQKDIVLLTLPMDSRKENALMVNVLQRCSSVVVQNSVQEGFGLTVAEAMWKRAPVLGSHACGIRIQIRDGIDGRLVHDPHSPEEIAETLREMLADPKRREDWARNAQRRVHDEFLIFTQLRNWIRVLAAKRDPRSHSASIK